METRKRARGQSLVEFALVLPLLILILLGVFDLGRAFNAYIVITNAAREGAYYGSLNPLDSNGIIARVMNETQNSGIAVTADDITVSCSGVKGSPMLITVSHDFSLITSFLIGTQVIQLQGRAEMMVL